jgi:hypothetical protein
MSTNNLSLYLDGHPTAVWVCPDPVILDFGPSIGVQRGSFGFMVSWTYWDYDSMRGRAGVSGASMYVTGALSYGESENGAALAAGKAWS